MLACVVADGVGKEHLVGENNGTHCVTGASIRRAELHPLIHNRRIPRHTIIRIRECDSALPSIQPSITHRHKPTQGFKHIRTTSLPVASIGRKRYRIRAASRRHPSPRAPCYPASPDREHRISQSHPRRPVRRKCHCIHRPTPRRDKIPAIPRNPVSIHIESGARRPAIRHTRPRLPVHRIRDRIVCRRRRPRYQCPRPRSNPHIPRPYDVVPAARDIAH